MTKKRADRIRRRVTCELQLGGRSYRGIVLDLSETGVFVQTEATPPPGTRLRVRLHASGGIEFEVDATVARRQVAPPQLATVVRGGLGLRVEAPPPAYFKLIGMESASSPGGARGVGGAPNAPVERPRPRSRRRRTCAPSSASAPSRATARARAPSR